MPPTGTSATVTAGKMRSACVARTVSSTTAIASPRSAATPAAPSPSRAQRRRRERRQAHHARSRRSIRLLDVPPSPVGTCLKRAPGVAKPAVLRIRQRIHAGHGERRDETKPNPPALYDITRTNAHDRAYWFIVQQCAVAAAEIAQPPLAAREPQLGVASRGVRVVDDDRVPGDAAEGRRRLAERNAAPGASDDSAASSTSRPTPAARRSSPPIARAATCELAHGRPQHHEQEEIDQRDERDAQCREEPTVGDELIDASSRSSGSDGEPHAAERHFVANGDGGGIRGARH